MNIESVPKMTTVETATAVLWGSLFTTGSALKTAAAPQMALPVAVSRARALSIFNSFPTKIPNRMVQVTIITSMSMAEAPMAITLWKVSRKP